MARRSRTLRGLPTPLAIFAALLLLPAAADARKMKIGSNLRRPATISEARGPDAAFWNVAGAALGNVVPADGQVTKLKLRGIAVPSNRPGAPRPRTEFHFQVLHPNGDGSVRVTLSTNPMHLPAGGNPNHVSTYRPHGYLCVKRGDYVDFNDEGGFVPGYYPNGVLYRVFASKPGAVTNVFSRDNGTNIGAVFTGSPRQGEELLLQAVLATGADASPVCGGMKGKVFHGLKIAKRPATVRRGSVPVRVTCPGQAQGRCLGTLALTAKGTVVGSIGLSVVPTTTINLHVNLSGAAKRMLRKGRRLRVIASADTRDQGGRRARTSSSMMLRG